MATALQHRRARMGGRDPDESHRAATPLELLFDLTFVAAYGLCANELAHYLAEGHVWAGLIGFAFGTFAITWAWVNFSWFASAYDTDDWIYRLTTMVQMIGVIVLALGLPVMFESVDEGETVDNRVMVAGYVVMRVAMVFQWIRASKQDPARRAACRTYVKAILVAQAGWIALLVAETSVPVTFVCAGLLVLVEFAGPWIAETRKGGTPWHAHHIAERYGLLVIIALGEGVLGTIVALSAVVGPEGPGWSIDAVAVAVAGIALTFGLWWLYFVVPSAEVLSVHRERNFGWGYGHIVLIGGVVGIGAGLHAAAYYLEDHSQLSGSGTVLTVVLPAAVFLLGVFVMYAFLTRTVDRLHVWLLAATAVLLVAPVLMASAGASMGACLLVLGLSPWASVIGYEVRGHRHNAGVIEALRAGARSGAR